MRYQRCIFEHLEENAYMLTRLLYVSTATGPITTTVTATILRSARQHNAANGITGVLCQGRSVYLQVLEGERSKVDILYGRIVSDKRHNKVVLRQHLDITSRRYGRWEMAHVDMAHLGSHLLASRQTTAFDPYVATAEEVMATIDALIAAGGVMDAAAA